MGKFKYGKNSERVISECRYDLQFLARELISMEIMDIAAICGRRGKEAQEKAFAKGYSKARWGESRHNVIEPVLSSAIDLAPYINGKIPWKEEDDPEAYKSWYILGGLAMAVAKKQSFNMKWGYYFKFPDLPHFQID